MTDIFNTNERVYLMIWKADSERPGYIDHGIFLDSQVPDDHNYDEVTGPHREYVEIKPGSDAWKVFVDPGSIDPLNGDMHLIHLNRDLTKYNWDTQTFEWVQTDPPGWEDIRASRNSMLRTSDTMFSFDTPEPLRSEWMFYREQLRQLIDNEIANGRTPGTAHMPIPPWPPSARFVGEFAPDPNTETNPELVKEIILHRPANVEKYGDVKVGATVGGIDLDTDLMALAKQIRDEVKALKGVPAVSIAPLNKVVHVGDPAFITSVTNTLGGPSNQVNTPDAPVDGTPGAVINTDVNTNI